MVSPYFSSYRKLAGAWRALGSEIDSLKTSSGVKVLSDHLSELAQICTLSGNRYLLDEFEGYRLISIWPSHFLIDESERKLAFDAIELLSNRVVHAFVLDRIQLEFCEHELTSAASVLGYAGWKYDPEVKYKGYFLEIRIDCRPNTPKHLFFESCWKELLTRIGLSREFHVKGEGNNWLIFSSGKLSLKTTEGQPRGLNASGVAFYGFSSLPEVRELQDRLGKAGSLLERTFNARIQGRDYPGARSALSSLRPGWEAIVTCDLLPENAELIASNQEPHVSEVPGASMSWKSSNKSRTAEMSLRFKHLEGQWHAFVDAFSNSSNAEQELGDVLAAHGYKREACER